MRALSFVSALMICAAMPAHAAPVINLGTAATFGVLAGSTVTNTGPTVINGNVGVSPGTAITGFGPGTSSGMIYSAGAVAAQAQTDLTTAYNAAAGLTGAIDLSGQDLGGLILLPGVYKFELQRGPHRRPDLEWSEQSRFGLRIPDRIDADFGERIVGAVYERWQCRQSVLASGQFGNVGDQFRFRRFNSRGDQHHPDHGLVASGRPSVGTERGGDSQLQSDHGADFGCDGYARKRDLGADDPRFWGDRVAAAWA